MKTIANHYYPRHGNSSKRAPSGGSTTSGASGRPSLIASIIALLLLYSFFILINHFNLRAASEDKVFESFINERKQLIASSSSLNSNSSAIDSIANIGGLRSGVGTQAATTAAVAASSAAVMAAKVPLVKRSQFNKGRGDDIFTSASAGSPTNASSSPTSPTIHTVTYASHGGRDDRFCRAIESSIRNGFDLIILGWGVKWQGLSQKLEAAHSFAKALPKNEVMLFTDAFDIIFDDSPASIAEKFTAFDTKILFSAECGCWPHVMEDKEACFKKYPPSPTPYRYLNSGTWIAYADAAAEMLADVIRQAGSNFANANDQKLVADMYISGKYNIHLDFYNTIFQSMHMTLDPPLPRCNPVEDVVLTPGGRWRNKLTKAVPAVLHFNGGGKAYHLKMEGKMWYKQAEHNTPEKKERLRQHLLSVPTAPGGKISFDAICPGYVK